MNWDLTDVNTVIPLLRTQANYSGMDTALLLDAAADMLEQYAEDAKRLTPVAADVFFSAYVVDRMRAGGAEPHARAELARLIGLRAMENGLITVDRVFEPKSETVYEPMYRYTAKAVMVKWDAT